MSLVFVRPPVGLTLAACCEVPRFARNDKTGVRNQVVSCES